MRATRIIDLPSRRVLTNFGTRYAVFGREPSVPQLPSFDPTTDTKALPRVSEGIEASLERILQTLRVSGMQTGPVTPGETYGDLALTDSEGNRTLIEVNVRESDPQTFDYQGAITRIDGARNESKALEVWFFNIGRLKLTAVSLIDGAPVIDEL